MKHIIIKSIRMVNFQAFKDKTIEFNDSENTIRGQNATGKSTIIRAFNWLLFNKDQFGQTDFSIKPLQKTGEPIHNVDSEVTAELISGDEEITLKKVYHEKWVKPRGQADAVFSGHESLYYFNGVPVTMREYNSKVESICPEQLFRLLTNPLYFPSLPWQEQRKLLFEICGNISDEEIASQQKAWTELLTTLNGHKTFDEYKREIASEKRKIKDELEKIPARIDEAQRALPQEEDWQNLNNVIASLRDQIQSIDKEITDLSSGLEKENEKCLHNQNLLNTKKRELQQLEFDIQMKAGQKYVELTHFRAMDSERIRSLKEEKTDGKELPKTLNKTSSNILMTARLC
jgi:Chromosome segregation ATPases